VLGVHPVKAREPVHLIEIELLADASHVDWRSFTQPFEGRDRSYWQVPYGEQPVPDRPNSWCFFFHYLDTSRPLQSFAGDLVLPEETPVPPSLSFIKYEEP
jgi:hypothetical protein